MTLNTLEPLAMKLDEPVQQGAGQSGVFIKSNIYQYLMDVMGMAGRRRRVVISARPARFAAALKGQRDCFAGSAPILKTDASRVVSDRETGSGDRREQAIRTDGACEAFPPGTTRLTPRSQ
ncbi:MULTISPECIES: hypothetical protein [unclassified Bradyrhizobium]|uniref:hypothetical protein n=1 Tax=unclassified Bradyrhizobium TaxID=2631580 RepID=UPI0028EE5498|nr:MULTISPECIES: hypothetical protein [unclassified Bradyrhizobium]